MAKKIAIIETSQGTIKIQLMPEVAPKACENMEKLGAEGYYDDTIFHRVIKAFMIQGGDPQGTGYGGESCFGKPFDDEFDSSVKFEKKYLLAMANSGPCTNGSQFFITTASTPWLNMKHTIFGEVIEGENVVDKIDETNVGPGDKPNTDQTIKSIKVVEEED